MFVGYCWGVCCKVMLFVVEVCYVYDDEVEVEMEGSVV